MKIFYAKIDEILKVKGEKFLLNFNDNKTYLSSKRLYEHCAGRFLINFVCGKFYNITKPQIVIKDKKPHLKNDEIYFSITHCNNVVMGVFSDFPCAIDLEKIRPVNLDKMSKRYNKNFATLEDFYKFWTLYEAEIKLHSSKSAEFSAIFQKDFMLSVLASKEFIQPPQIIEIELDKK